MNSTLHRHFSPAIAWVWIAALILPQVCFAQQPAVSRDVLLEASPQLYWIARVEPDDQPPRVVSIVQVRSIGGAPQWKQIAQIGHRITSLSRFGSQLAALLDNGDWMIISDGDGAPGRLPEDASKLLMLAESSGPSAKLWAIAVSGGGRVPTTAGATQPAYKMALNTRLLYAFDHGEWNLMGPLPDEIKASDTLSLSANDSPLLTARSDAGVVHVFKWNDLDRKWESLGSVNAAPGFTQAKILDNSDRLMLWLCDDNGSGEVRMRSDANDTNWSHVIKIPLPAGAPKGAASDAVVAGGNIRLVLFTQDGKLLEYPYPMDGSGSVQPTTLPTMTTPAEPKAFEWISAIVAGLLMIVLLTTMRRRGQSVPPEAIEAAGMKLAPFGLRLLAGMIDALPVIGTVGIFIARSNVTDLQQMDEATQNSLSTMYIIAVAVYVFHTLVSEALWGWTIGKKLCGLRVVNLDGSRPSLRAVVLRNVLRIVDVTMFYLPPLLVFVSPLRQRAGDIAAETIVIVAKEHSEPEQPKT